MGFQDSERVIDAVTSPADVSGFSIGFVTSGEAGPSAGISSPVGNSVPFSVWLLEEDSSPVDDWPSETVSLSDGVPPGIVVPSPVASASFVGVWPSVDAGLPEEDSAPESDSLPEGLSFPEGKPSSVVVLPPDVVSSPEAVSPSRPFLHCLSYCRRILRPLQR